MFTVTTDTIEEERRDVGNTPERYRKCCMKLGRNEWEEERRDVGNTPKDIGNAA